MYKMNKHSKTYMLLLEKKREYNEIVLNSENDMKNNTIRSSCSKYIIDKYKKKLEILNKLIDELA
tara:strand:- start:549 stop:743 length:195 start_codon:yes stop_codon:yes gene_type:complete